MKREELQESLFFETRDIYEAAVVHTFQKPVISVSRDRDGMCHFMFEDRAYCEKLVNDYRNRMLMINAKTFIESIRTMKEFIKGTERRGNGRD